MLQVGTTCLFCPELGSFLGLKTFNVETMKLPREPG